MLVNWRANDFEAASHSLLGKMADRHSRWAVLLGFCRRRRTTFLRLPVQPGLRLAASLSPLTTPSSLQERLLCGAMPLTQTDPERTLVELPASHFQPINQPAWYGFEPAAYCTQQAADKKKSCKDQNRLDLVCRVEGARNGKKCHWYC